MKYWHSHLPFRQHISVSTLVVIQHTYYSIRPRRSFLINIIWFLICFSVSKLVILVIKTDNKPLSIPPFSTFITWLLNFCMPTFQLFIEHKWYSILKTIITGEDVEKDNCPEYSFKFGSRVKNTTQRQRCLLFPNFHKSLDWLSSNGHL